MAWLPTNYELWRAQFGNKEHDWPTNCIRSNSGMNYWYWFWYCWGGDLGTYCVCGGLHRTVII